MSDYQDVTLKKVEGSTLVLEVVENGGDMAVLANLMEDGKITEEHRADAAKVAAMMLLEWNGRGNNAFADEAVANDYGFDDADKLVRDVQVGELAQIGTTGLDEPRYRATLRVTLVDPEKADEIPVGDTWGTAAHPGADLDDYFG